MPYVNSSAIARVEYDPLSRTLSIWFHVSGRYDYYDVPSGLYQGLLYASSKGTFFNRFIRDDYGNA